MHNKGSVDQVYRFDPATDTLDVRTLLAEANVDLHADVAGIAGYLAVTDQGSNALVRYDPTGHGGGGTVAVLHGVENIAELNTLFTQGAARIIM